MNENKEKRVQYCVFCGKYIEEGRTYCPNCGKLVLKLKPGEKQVPKRPITAPKPQITRKCSGCGSIITSSVLDQCPICNTVLEKISEQKKLIIQKKPGLVFTNKKFEVEQKFILKKDTWNLKEGINLFGNCLYILIIIYFLLSTIIAFQVETTDIELNIGIILLGQIPELLFGIYPLWYIYSKKHSYKKLGLKSESKKFILAVLIGLLGGLCLFLINYFFGYLIDFISDVGLDFLKLKETIEKQNSVIRDADLLPIILLVILLSLASFSTEIVFRGVMHNTLKERFKSGFKVILLVASIYTLVMLLLFSFNFFMNFIIFMVLGLLYEINENLYNTIIASVFYNLLIIIVLVL
ncbi:MAG: type II CAAX prenyl endopeptidase Rce1 family protein [Candidatus Hodarchaeota archaeon]